MNSHAQTPNGGKEGQTGGVSGLLFITLLAIVATVLCYRAFNDRYDRELHNAVTSHLAELFPKANIYVGYIHKTSVGEIVVSDVCFAYNHRQIQNSATDLSGMPTAMSQQTLQDKRGPKQKVLTAQRIVLRGNLDITDWVQETIAVKEVDLFGVTLEAWPIDSQRWSLECIVPKPCPDSMPPRVVFHDANLNLRHDSDPKSLGIAFHHLTCTVEPQSPASDNAEQSRGSLVATLRGNSPGTVEAFSVRAQILPSSKTWSATGTVNNLSLSQSLQQRLPQKLSDYLSQLSGLECLASAEFSIVSASDQAPLFKVRGNLTSGRLQDARLPYVLENLCSEFSIDNQKIQLRNMRAENGGTQLTLDTDIEGLGPDSPMTIVANASHLQLDNRLYQSLPKQMQDQWDKLQLAGIVSGRVTLLFDGTRWTPSLSVDCEEVSLTPWLFPYPITELKGKVTFQNSTISSQHLTASVGGQVATGHFSLTRIGTEWIGRLDAETGGSVSIDEQLISALTPRHRSETGAEKFVRSLTPSGTIRLTRASFERKAVHDIWHRSIDANIYKGSINYAGFQYPIYDIRGRIVGKDDRWSLDQFEGRNDSGRILCSGDWQSVKSGNVPLDLKFEAFAVPIEEDLKLALPADAQFVWDELRPSGAIDRVAVRINRPTATAAVTTLVSVSEESASNDAERRSLRVHPKTFPYWLTDVDCQIDYRPGHVNIEHATGVNGASRLALKGTCQPTADGRWKAKIEWLPQTRLIVENGLLAALPQSLQESLDKIDFRGPISVQGKSDVVFADETSRSLQSTWDCQVAIEDGQLADGKTIGSLRGTVWMQGRSDGSDVSATGSVEMNALSVRGIPVTRLTGPFALIENNLYFGERVSEVLQNADQELATEMTANALSGRLSFSGIGKMDTGKFHINAGLRSADLRLLLKDFDVDSTDSNAVCDADINFSGVPWNAQTYDGQGQIRLREAQLYQLPFMIRLMRVASVNASDDSAFQTANIAFELDGDHIPLRVECDGEVLRLRGEGWTNLRRKLELNLYSYVGRSLPDSLSPLLAESQYATFMLIEVGGTLDNPVMQRQPFPQMQATIQQIFPELADRRSESILPWRR